MRASAGFLAGALFSEAVPFFKIPLRYFLRKSYENEAIIGKTVNFCLRG